MPNVELETGLLTKEEFFRRLSDEVDAAVRAERAYSVLAVVAQHFPDEDMTDVVRVAADCVAKLVRDGDLGGYVDDQIIAIGLYNGDCTSAAILAQRLQGDLRLRSFHLRSTLWDIGLACLPQDGVTAQRLLSTAIDAAKHRRRRLGAKL